MRIGIIAVKLHCVTHAYTLRKCPRISTRINWIKLFYYAVNLSSICSKCYAVTLRAKECNSIAACKFLNTYSYNTWDVPVNIIVYLVYIFDVLSVSMIVCGKQCAFNHLSFCLETNKEECNLLFANSPALRPRSLNLFRNTAKLPDSNNAGNIAGKHGSIAVRIWDTYIQLLYFIALAYLSKNSLRPVVTARVKRS